MISFGKNTNLSSAKYTPHLYDRIKSIVLGFTNNSLLSSTREVITIPSDYDSTNPDYSDTDSTFSVFEGGLRATNDWTLSVDSFNECIVSQVDETFTVDSVSADEAYYIVQAVKADNPTLTKRINVSKIKQGVPSVYVTASSYAISIPCDVDGDNPVLTNSDVEFKAFFGHTDETDAVTPYSWTFTPIAVSNLTATTVSGNIIRITSISGDTGYYDCRARTTRPGIDDIIVRVYVKKVRDGLKTDYWKGSWQSSPTTYNQGDTVEYEGSSYISLTNSNEGNTPDTATSDWDKVVDGGLAFSVTPDDILIPAAYDGTVSSYANAVSTIEVRRGLDIETDDWTFSIDGYSNVTAIIQNDNEVAITDITADEGWVRIDLDKPGYPNLSRITIPVYKLRQGPPFSSDDVDDATVKLNGSNELYVNREEDGKDAIFGAGNEMVSHDTSTGISDSENFIFRSNTLRRPKLNQFNSLETVDSYSSFESRDNILLGADNIVDVDNNIFTNPTGYSVYGIPTIIDNGSKIYLSFKVSDGDLTSFYTIGERVFVYIDGSLDSRYYKYISGTVSATPIPPTFSGGSQTILYLDADYTFDQGTQSYFNDNFGEDIVAIKYEPYAGYEGYGDVGSSGNYIYGSNNFVKGSANSIAGSGNRLLNSVSNLIYGSSWIVNNEFENQYYNSVGNVLIGRGNKYGINGALKGQDNLIISKDGNWLCEHENNYSNIVVGGDIIVGQKATPQGYGVRQCVAIGHGHELSSDYSNAFGFGAVTTTPGEIILSSSYSSVQKAIYILEVRTATTSATPIRTLARSNDRVTGGRTIPLEHASNIVMSDDTAFSGTLDITGYQDNGDSYREKLYINFHCIAGVISTPTTGAEYTYTDGFTGALAYRSITGYTGTHEEVVEDSGTNNVSLSWTGAHDGSNGDTRLRDTGAPWLSEPVGSLRGWTVINITQATTGIISGNNSGWISSSLTWNTGDVYEIYNYYDLVDTTKSWTIDEFIGYTIYNVTDGSFGVILSNTATTITSGNTLVPPLEGGTINYWRTGDAYRIVDPAILYDSTKTWTPGELVGALVRNTTDVSIGRITANTADTATVDLDEGTNNYWNDGDEYIIHNELEITVAPSETDMTRWTCIVEGITTDI